MKTKLQNLTINPFATYEGFRSIWPKRIQEIEEDHINFLNCPCKEDKFLILRNSDSKPIGVTGYFELDDKIVLCWHGILPSERGLGYSEDALKQLLQIVAERYPQSKEIIELVPEDREAELGRYFKKIGFIKTGNIIQHECLVQGVTWLEYKREL